MSETKEESSNLNECAASPNADLGIDSMCEKPGIKVERETGSLVDDGINRTSNDGNVEDIIEINNKKTVNVKPIDREVNNIRRVLRSGSVARDPANSNKHRGAVENKRKRARKEDLSKGENMNTVSGRSSVLEVKEEKYENVESPVLKETHGDDFRSQTNVNDRSDDEYGSIEPHGKEVQVKRKRGRPRKMEISQSSVDRLSLKPRRGRPPKTKETAIVPYIKKKNVKCTRVSTLITQDQIMSDSFDESRRPKRNCVGKDKGPESEIGNCRGRKMVGKHGQHPTPKTKRKSGEPDGSDCQANKRLKLCKNPLESQNNNPLIDGERRIGEQQNNQSDAGRQSKAETKKMLSDRILQLLMAAGWTVQYRPRNGRDYEDAVYVNPEGKTHWSVTKAYYAYKEHLQSRMNDPVNSTTGSGFGLLPEEDLHLLARRTQKKRSDTGKQRQNWKDIDTNLNMISTKEIGTRTLHSNKVQKKENCMQKKRKRIHGSHNLERIPVSVRKIKRGEKHKRKRCALSARSSLEDVDSKDNGYSLYEGKRTILGWMIDSAIVSLNGKLQCMSCKETQVCLEGIITREGIRCNCCDIVFSVLDFEVHSGGKHNQPFKSLYLEGGSSLLQCFLEFWNKQSESMLKGFHSVDFGAGDQSDDTCGICGDGGDLICCDGCPSTFHQSCLGIKKSPSGAWFCCYCSCKFCEKVEAANHDTTTPSPLLRCHLCEEKYHQDCIKQEDMVPGEMSTHSFCGKYCQEIFEGLQLLIGVKHSLPEGFSWTFLRRVELPHEVSDCDVSEKIAYNAKLAVAFSVMDECFSPLVDHRSGVNLLENIVYNFRSNFHRQNYSSFLTAVLERGDETIGVASIRIHGNKLAEMPFIGTRYMYRRQGMCRRLMDGIESALDSLKVAKLVIPAVPELIDTWTSGFGFKSVPEPEKKAIKNLNLLVFPGVDMLEKSIVKDKIAEPNVSSSNGYLSLAPAMSLSVDVEENKPDESKDGAHEGNCETADTKSPSDAEDSCLKSVDAEDGDNDTESNLKLLNVSLGDIQVIKKLTEKDVDTLTDVADDQRESNLGAADDSHADLTDTKRYESGDLEDKTPLSDDGHGIKAEATEESDQQSDCYIIDQSQPVGNGDSEKEIDNKTLVVKKEVSSSLRVSSRLIQKSWKTSPVNPKYTGTNAVLLDSPSRCV